MTGYDRELGRRRLNAEERTRAVLGDYLRSINPDEAQALRLVSRARARKTALKIRSERQVLVGLMVELGILALRMV